MKYINDFRHPEDSKKILSRIEKTVSQIDQPIHLMEVCGGHTYTIFRHGLHQLLPDKINLISGPGCPVCVTDQAFIDEAIEYAKLDDTIIVTFGDMARVPGSNTSLNREKSRGAAVKICYSPMEAIEVAQRYPNKEIIFLAFGFETTAPLSAAVVLEAEKENLPNFSLLSAHKTMPEALFALLNSDCLQVDGLICPGHVSAITGFSIYERIVYHLNIPSVISGFEPNDILQTIFMLCRQIQHNTAKIENQYKRAVRADGNQKAKQLIQTVFEPVAAKWRGIGEIPGSGLELQSTYSRYNIRQKRPITVPPTKMVKGCLCGEIMQGIKKPTDCQLFGTSCTPQNPQGACMVSTEGSCGTYYKFRE